MILIFLLYLLVFSIVVYSLYMLFIIIGITKVPDYSVSESKYQNFVSVIVPFRNEETNLKPLVSCLDRQEYSKEKLEIIFINDHSDDNSLEILNDLISGDENFKVVNLTDQTGKKAALNLGINEAKGDIIVTTDADCVMGNKWITTIVSYHNETGSKLIISPVQLHPVSDYFDRFQEAEFLSLQAVTIGTSGLNSPVLSNGANLAFSKDLFLKLSDPYNRNFSSGDDIFLLQNIKKEKEKIGFLKSKDAIVKTMPNKNIKSFVNQRKRWFSKAKGYKDIEAVISTLIIGMSNISVLGLLVLSIFYNKYFNYFFICFGLKFILDLYLIKSVSKFYKSKIRVYEFIVNEFIYSIYSIFILLISLITKKEWKGRGI